MAKAALKVKGVIPSTTMRLPNIGPDATQLDKAEEGCALPDCCKPETLHTGCQPAAPA